MRPLSRLLSVFIALIMMATGFLTVSAHDPGVDGNTVTKSAVTVFVDLVTDISDGVHPGDVLKFNVSVYRDDTGHDITALSVAGPDPDATVTTDDLAADALGNLTNSNIVESGEVSYTVGALPTNVTSQTISLVWTATFTPVDAGTAGSPANPHTAVTDAASDPFDITVTTRGSFASEIIGLELDFSATTGPGDMPARGDKVTFKLTATMGDDYGLVDADDALASPTGTDAGHSIQFFIRRTLVDADGEDVKTSSAAVFSLPVLGRNSQSSELKSNPETYSLRAEDIATIEDGGTVRFHYTFAVGENNVRKADGTAPDLNKDGDMVDKIADVSGTILEIPAPVVEPEATPSPYLYETDAATVMELAGGTAIELTRLDTGSTITLTLGTLSSTGALLPRDSGYIRDESRGQTYAVVRRADGMVVRVWISASSEWVSHVPWENVNAFYSVPADVLNAIPLDDTMPEVDQLVVVGEKWYVYRDRAWRHIPNLSTFRANGFFWCDLTTADDSHAAASSTATPLPSEVGPPEAGYPACHNE